MRIDTSPETLTRNLPAHVPTPVPLDDVLFIGGVTPTTTIPFHLPVLKSFEGDIKRVIINQTTVLDGRYKIFILYILLLAQFRPNALHRLSFMEIYLYLR